MQSIGESALAVVLLFIFIPLAVALTCGFISAWIAKGKYRSKRRWFLVGFLFPVVGLVAALFIPSAREPYGLRMKRLRRAIDADIKSGDKGFRERAANLCDRVREMDEVAGGINHRLQEMERRLRDKDPQRIARRLSQVTLRLSLMRDGSRAQELRAETEALEEELRTFEELEERAKRLRQQLAGAVSVAEKLSHKIRRLSFSEEAGEREEELQEIVRELAVEVEALEELQREMK